MIFRRAIVAMATMAVMSQIAFGVVVFSDDDADWSVSSANPPNPAWTGSLLNSDASVHGSGQAGVEFSGPQTQGQIGPFDDYITENNNLSANANGGDLANAGNYGISSAEFQFYNDSGTYQPAELSLYFTDGTHEWYSDLALPSGPGWTSYTVSMLWGSWYDVAAGGDATDFATSLTSVTELGIRILYDNAVVGPQNYGLANFELHEVDPGAVPEPGTYVMLSTVLMSLGFTFGRKKKQPVAA